MKLLTRAGRSDAVSRRERENLAVAYQAACEGIVLLKNDGILPLNKTDEVAFIGEFAAKPRFQGGGSSHINAFRTTSAVEAAQGIGEVRRWYTVKDQAGFVTDDLSQGLPVDFHSVFLPVLI